MPRLFYFAERVGIHDRRFLAKFSEAGWELDVCGAVGPSAWPEEWKALPGLRSWRSLGLPGFSLAADEEEKARQRLRGWAEEARPDLILSGPLHTAGWLAATAGLRPLGQISLAYDLLWNAEREALARERTVIALHGADLLLVDCEAVRKQARRHAPSSLPTVNIPFGIDLRSNPLPSRGVPAHPFTVLSSRNWESVYAIEVVLGAFASARKEITGLRLLLAGDGSLRGEVRAEIERLELGSSVTLTGRYDAAAWATLVADSDLYLSCARTDGTSISLLEAMAAGLPVLVTDLESNREWVEEGIHGWLAPADDAEAFSRKIVAAANMPQERRREMGGRNRREVEARADWDRNFPIFLEACRRAARLP